MADTGNKLELPDEAHTMEVVNAITGKPFTVREIKKGKKTKNPAPPFTTSTLQQEASRKLNFQSQRTMKVAQELYEGINLGSEFGGVQGLITYMRTDSLRIADEAREAARTYIQEKYGEDYCASKPRVYKSKANAQDAHEAIRPSGTKLDPASIKKALTSDQYRLYKLIWDRFIASQMESAELATMQIDLVNGPYLFRTSGHTVTFPGFMAVYEETTDEKTDDDEAKALPILQIGRAHV